jgi:hypothetical protein
MVQIGQLLGVQQLVTGSIGKLGSMYLLNLRVIDIKTAKIAKVVSEDIKGDIEDLVGRLPHLAARLAGGKNLEDQAHAPAPLPAREQPPPPVRGAAIYLERISIDPAIAGFTPANDIIDDICSQVRDGLQDAFDTDIAVANQDQLQNAAASGALVVRCVLQSYITKPARFNQKTGTARVSVQFYRWPTMANPVFTASFNQTGDRHWGDETPLVNAWEAVGKAIQDDLSRTDFVRSCRAQMKKR